MSLNARIGLGFAVALLAILAVTVVDALTLAGLGAAANPAESLDVARRVTLGVGVAALAGCVGIALLVVRSINRDLREATAAITQASIQFSESARHQASGSNQQAAAVSQVSTTMEQLARTADEIAEIARQTLESAESGTLAVRDALAGMERIKGKVEAMARRILALGEKSDQIGEIIEIVNGIADKTHLLAINAAIESAAAGEFGRRFAVVASQVKELADESKEATRPVKSIVNEIQSATNALVLATEDATKEADAGSQLAGRAGGALDEIVAMIHTITMATQQQRAASERADSTMRDIAAVAQDSAGSSAQAAEGAARLSVTSRRLHGLIGGDRRS